MVLMEPISSALDRLPSALGKRSGSIFYSGPAAFSTPSAIYVLGLNPGGSATKMADRTIDRQFADWRQVNEPWSAYVDEEWQGKPKGTHGMQPRIRHMFEGLGLDLRNVPASNVVFARSNNEKALKAEKAELLEQCWPVHEAVIGALGIHTILCFGSTAGRWVRDAIGAHRVIGSFTEQNKRKWKSQAHEAPDGRTVVTLTHPGRADWRNPDADPTPLIRSVIARSRP